MLEIGFHRENDVGISFIRFFVDGFYESLEDVAGGLGGLDDFMGFVQLLAFLFALLL